VDTISGTLPLLSAAFLNGIRRDLADLFDATPVQPIPLRKGIRNPKAIPASLDYKANIANQITKDIYNSLGSTVTEPAYELTHRQDAELMRSRYCLRKEIGLCPSREPLFLKNNGRTLRLDFDCKACEMIVR
jgi:putative protease